ncbi:hypothetical protein P153DRAFT_387808 [Dothidotthia symphoricarpi CBS 119687]|uniref:Uncharacterized protein n=1 Tax=Dothidotthia symphoricarpi CBS 119687 TaxID=1392245 RepID=A0A6A6A5K8_9PLEO|nr:uncharacterized protein P153DRAFT_387808 [Dothidotthia symphoricarpi CBS 119687]KAF2127262.1 hypothetical protein P153DRAFT_387808 [Dothidotthia symphoricarpi CBS 119687]
MTTHNAHNTHALNARDLSTRLANLQSHHQSDNAHTDPTPTSGSRRPRASSLDALPRFTKSPTMSTTSTSVSSATTCRDSVEVPVGAFSKPCLGRKSRRATDGERKGEFQYYGRHANQWLFNGFSVTGAVRRGFGKVFRKEGRSGGYRE